MIQCRGFRSKRNTVSAGNIRWKQLFMHDQTQNYVILSKYIEVQNESSRSWISGKNNSKRNGEITSVEVSKGGKFLSITLAKRCTYFSIVTKKSSNYRVYIDGLEKQIWRRFYMRIAWLPFMFTTKYKIKWNNHGQISARSCSTDNKPTCKCTSEQ